MIFDSLALAPMPQLQMGNGKISLLADIVKSYGQTALLITGGKSFQSTKAYTELLDKFSSDRIIFHEFKVDSEPSPSIVDNIVGKTYLHRPDVIIGIGGGSVLDAAKAISAMLPLNEPVKTYLEGVGTKSSHPGFKVPFIAVPTTSGTGSETTRNAVLSEVGEQGYKRSLRHMNFVSNVTILDPQLMINCPPAITASSGMDAFTQLLESLLSTVATPLTDSIALKGLSYVAEMLPVAFKDPGNLNARAGMALAAYLSGITLTNVGLGLVHALAGMIGGYKNIPHGIICSALMPAANKLTLSILRQKAIWHPALKKYTEAGKLFTNTKGKTDNYYADLLIDTIYRWNTDMKIPTLMSFGVTHDDIVRFAARAENKNNPVPLNQEEIMKVLQDA
ncbi:MAG: iron-containing alcohol dehydrogenase [Chryseolinea sp.]